MGVSITVYSDLEFIVGNEDLSEEAIDTLRLCDKLVYLYPNPHFMDHTDGLKEGFYYYADTADIMHRSYSGYGLWRETLCKIIHEVQPKVVWNHPEAFADKPFYRLIHFSDCEGFLGPKTSINLLGDFDLFQDIIKENWSLDFEDSFVENWIAGLELAKENGVVTYG